MQQKSVVYLETVTGIFPVPVPVRRISLKYKISISFFHICFKVATFIFTDKLIKFIPSLLMLYMAVVF
ncbi:hypothetical protein T03_1302 [Trichinella britovi]|uniref:Uncharacterized protein n=1 Tax=Trichinella britovi TaxID=45882 RepID=A0A0V1DHN5_TRIBR|nr:hypothetical protein T03_1302 [Trichinella britovi]